jgi:hypothetical protein
MRKNGVYGDVIMIIALCSSLENSVVVYQKDSQKLTNFHLQATLITWTITMEVKTTCFYCISKNQFTLIIVLGDRKRFESLKRGFIAT